MYKPVPFFMSSRGYGIFLHTSVPITCDFGNAYDAATTLFVGDESLDAFVFLGEPKEILQEYTSLTGRSPMPPLWSFGLWMSRMTYKSEQDTREVAAECRKQRVPCDVVHLDTGWFETDWRCDYQFSKTRFENPVKMLAAPLMEETKSRDVYLPPGKWIDYQTRHVFEGAKRHSIEAGAIPCVILVREGTVIVQTAIAQSTDQIDWSSLECHIFALETNELTTTVCVPRDTLKTLRLKKIDKHWVLHENPLGDTPMLLVLN